MKCSFPAVALRCAPPSTLPYLPPRVSDRVFKDELSELPSVSSLGAESTDVVRAKAPRIAECSGVVGKLLNPPAGRLIVRSSLSPSCSSVLGIWSVGGAFKCERDWSSHTHSVLSLTDSPLPLSHSNCPPLLSLPLPYSDYI